MIDVTATKALIAHLQSCANDLYHASANDRRRLLEQSADLIRAYRDAIAFSEPETDDPNDIERRLRRMASEVDQRQPGEVAAILLKAAGVLDALRTLLDCKW